MPPETTAQTVTPLPGAAKGRKATPPRIAYSPKEFAAMTGLHYQSVLSAIHAGEIPAEKFGKQLRIPAAYVRQLAGMDEAA